jgi:hypothetical protein
LAVPDFGTPNQLALAIAIEKPVHGVYRLATSVVFGEPEDLDADAEEYQERHYVRKNIPRMAEESDV